LNNSADHSTNTGSKFTRGISNFGKGLIDFRFQQYLSMQLLPVFYALLLLGILGFFLALNIAAFWYSHLVGIFILAVTPFALLIAFAVTRAALECLVMAYRIMETVQRMDRIPQQVDNLNSKVDGISDKVHEFETQINHISGQVNDVTHVISFLKPISDIGALPKRWFRR
jgi:outer membrane murein-binding lipoprotein Lpp